MFSSLSKRFSYHLFPVLDPAITLFAFPYENNKPQLFLIRVPPYARY